MPRRCYPELHRGAADMSVMEPVEPLAESAPLAWAEAPQRCTRNAESGASCVSYHRVWQYLRLLGVITTIRTNTSFLVSSFRTCARGERFPRVLVSGSADYSMLAHVACGYKAEGCDLDATVVDLCDTSLFLNRWYAAEYGIRLTTLRASVLDEIIAPPFDVVCTHNFLSSFDAANRRRIVARWYALLRPGGVVVTTQRIQPENGSECNVFTDQQAESLRQQVAAAAAACPQPLTVPPQELAVAAYDYARQRRSYVVRANRDITDLFTDVGFQLDMADSGGGAAERAGDRPARSIGAETYRMRIVAVKP